MGNTDRPPSTTKYSGPRIYCKITTKARLAMTIPQLQDQGRFRSFEGDVRLLKIDFSRRENAK
jgi:hypothetical protein